MAVNHAASFFEPALQSLADQTFTDFELILVDNNSRDGTDRIIERVGREGPADPALPYPTSLGLARCLNFAATHTRAPSACAPRRRRRHPSGSPLAGATCPADAAARNGLLGACVEVIGKDDNLIGRRHLPLTERGTAYSSCAKEIPSFIPPS